MKGEEGLSGNERILTVDVDCMISAHVSAANQFLDVVQQQNEEA